MSERDTILLLLDIRSSIIKIFEYTAGMDFEHYEADAKTKDAVERNFEIIGEAASRIPEDFKKVHDRVEWRIIKDFRNFIIHEYFGINNLIVWDIIEHRLPELLTEVSAMLASEGSENQ